MKNLVRRFLIMIGWMEKNANDLTMKEYLQSLSNEMRKKYELKENYICCNPSGSNDMDRILIFKVSEFNDHNFIVAGVAMYPYLSLGGYFIPPKHIIDQMKAAESNIKIISALHNKHN